MIPVIFFSQYGTVKMKKSKWENSHTSPHSSPYWKPCEMSTLSASNPSSFFSEFLVYWTLFTFSIDQPLQLLLFDKILRFSHFQVWLFHGVIRPTDHGYFWKKQNKKKKQSIEEALTSVDPKQKEQREKWREKEEEENPKKRKGKRRGRLDRRPVHLLWVSFHLTGSDSLFSCL